MKERDTDSDSTRRFLPGKIAFAILVVYLAATVAGRIWWGTYAEQKLASVLDAIHQRGESTDWRWAKPAKPIPDSINAAEFYKAATDLPDFKKAVEMKVPGSEVAWQPHGRYTRTSEVDLMPKLLDEPGYRKSHPAELRQFLDLTRASLAVARKARDLKQADYKLDFDAENSWSAMVPNLSCCRQLARALNVAARAAHDEGDDAKALDCLHDCLAVGRSLQTAPVLIAHLVHLSTNSMAVGTIELISHSMKAGDGRGAASQEQVRELIRELMDDKGFGQGLPDSMISERNGMLDSLQKVADGDLSLLVLIQTVDGMQSGSPLDAASSSRMRPAAQAASYVFVRPVCQLDTAFILEYENQMIQAWQQGRYVPLAGPSQATWSGIGRIGHFVSSTFTPSFGRVSQIHYRSLANRRMAATALAIRLYEADHASRPAKLVDLVPAYLPAVPVDPFSPTGKPIGYRPKGKHPLLYSISVNQIDDGGKFGTFPGGGVDDGTLDQPFFLNGDRDAAAAAASPVQPSGPGGGYGPPSGGS